MIPEGPDVGQVEKGRLSQRRVSYYTRERVSCILIFINAHAKKTVNYLISYYPYRLLLHTALL